MKIIADMHTHSENSHDSVCPIEEMCLAQLEKGTNVMAVTDHADIFSYSDYDIYTPIQKTYETVNMLNEKYEGKMQLLTGVEISEGFWFSEQSKKMRKLCNYDVIIGSVHCVRHRELTFPYSRIDFSVMSEKDIYSYLDSYFNDVLEMLEKEDFDILAHLTCPLRYITGKYNIRVDMDRYMEKIDGILSQVIEKKISLEVNTSSRGILGDYMPSEILVKRYFDMGGRLVTLGSDAHVADNAAGYFEEAIQTLKKIGFKRAYYYKKRTPVAYEI